MHPVVGDKYKHYKGNLYRVCGVAAHTESSERLVVYQRSEDVHPWARPLGMWNELVHHDGRSSRRFVHVPEQAALEKKPEHCAFCRAPVQAWPIDFGGWHVECRECGTSADVIRTRSAV